MRSRFETRGRPPGLVLLCLLPAGLSGQTALLEAPRRLSGSLVAGWMSTTAQETFRERRSNPFTTLRLDYQSYLLDPALLTYRVQPRFSSGFQGGFTGLSEGTGVAFESVFLPARPWPLRFHFSRFRRSSLTSGLASSYARYIAENDDSTIGLQWQYVVPGRPVLNLSLDRVQTATEPEAVLAQGFETRSRTLALNASDNRGGWNLNGSLSFQRLNQRYPFGQDRQSVVLESDSDLSNLVVAAQRPLRKSLNLLLSGHRTTNQIDFERGRFDQAFESGTARLEYRPGGRFQAWSQGRLLRSTLESQASRLAGGGFLIPASRATHATLDSEARYQIHPTLSVFARNEATQVRSPVAGLATRAGNFWNTGGGAQFFRTKRWLSLGASYYLYTTLTRFRLQSPGDLLGHALDASVSAGDPARLRAGAAFSLTRSREDVRSLLFSTSSSERARLSLARTLFRRWNIEAHGALSTLRFERPDLRSEFLGKDYGLALTAPRYYFSFSRAQGAGDSFQPLLSITSRVPAGFTPAFLPVIGSSDSSTDANASWTLARQIAFRAIWRRQSQTIGPLLASRFEQREATLNWSFRRVRLEGGYLVYRFDFGSPILRKLVIARLTRDFRLF